MLTRSIKSLSRKSEIKNSMPYFKFYSHIIFLFTLAFLSCKSGNDDTTPDKKKNDSLAAEQTTAINYKTQYQQNSDTGIVGVVQVPQMLALSKLDSAPLKDVPAKIIKNFSLLEQDVNTTGAELDGPQGMIYYTNTPENFKFECLLLIKKIPSKTPKYGKVNALKAANMLIYNYYGASENTYKAYAILKTVLIENNFVQIGPAREFYPTHKDSEIDSSKLYTRIMLPIAKAK
jgi:effector-binding domain-containing protein